MAVAWAPRLGLCPHITTALRLSSNAVALGCRTYATSPKPAPNTKTYTRRLRPANVQTFYDVNGKIRTTHDNRVFLSSNGILIDNGQAYQLRELSVLKPYGVTLFYHPQHFVHPFQLEFLDPRGHPLAAHKRAELLEKHNTQHLWSMATCAAKGVSTVVRSRAQRRVRAMLYAGLERAGYDMYGRGEGKSLYGSVWFVLHRPVEFMNQPPVEAVGDTIVTTIEDETRRLRRRKGVEDEPARNHPRPNDGIVKPRNQRNNDWSGANDERESYRPEQRRNDWGRRDNREFHRPEQRRGDSSRNGQRSPADKRQNTRDRESKAKFAQGFDTRR